jgi:hypothetical protein
VLGAPTLTDRSSGATETMADDEKEQILAQLQMLGYME